MRTTGLSPTTQPTPICEWFLFIIYDLAQEIPKKIKNYTQFGKETATSVYSEILISNIEKKLDKFVKIGAKCEITANFFNFTEKYVNWKN